ncbi:MAG: hypothetical protein IKB46_03015 [Paludibacteraceae bacterium]|nr:hypothetical protein [Paludibacteraceae bacterium]
MHAQLFSTSSYEIHSYGGGGNGFASMSSSAKSGATSFSGSSAASTTIGNYSTAPMRMANGTIQTVASTLSGGILADETGFTSDAGDTGFIPTGPQRSIAPPDVDAPLHLDWDALLFIFLLLIPYLYRVDKRRISGE